MTVGARVEVVHGDGDRASAVPDARVESTTPWVRRWLRAEGIAAVGLGVAVWLANGAQLIWFVPLLLVPDVSMLGYLRGPHAGAITYNVVHNWFVGGLVLGLGVWLSQPALALAGAVLVAHTGIDRVAGYGLKYPTSFQETHLGRIGRNR